MDIKPEYERNGFDILRYAAAMSVMMLHYSGYVMILSENLPDRAAAFMDKTRYITLLFPGVVILFAMSGFLVSASFERSKTRRKFFYRRILRVYPELWICTVVNLAVVCLLVPGMLDRSMILWLGTQFFGIANTPDCLKNFATGSINGALWTVFTEVQLYIVLGIIYPCLRKIKNRHWAAVLTGFAALNLVCGEVMQDIPGVVSKLIERTCIPYALWFFTGVFCYQNRQRLLPVLRAAFLPMLAVYLMMESTDIKIPGYYTDIVASVLLPFLVIGCAYCLPKVCWKADLSYGIFLYHWIVLNIIVHYDLMNRLPWYAGLILFLGGSVIAVAVSRSLYLCFRIMIRRLSKAV